MEALRGRKGRRPLKKSRHYAGYGPEGPRGAVNGRDLLSAKGFFDLLRRRTARNAAAVDRRIERGLTDLAILVSDSSGFSRKTQEHGILQFLAVMTRCYDRLIPLLEKEGGLCLSHNADNILAVFAEPAAAARAAAAMHRWLKAYNRGRREAERFNICIGLHWGTVIRLKDNVFGDTVNVAAKIGEDMAGKDEILATREFMERAGEGVKSAYLRSTKVGGRTFELHLLPY